MSKTISMRIFILLMVVYAVLAGASIYLPQGSEVSPIQAAQMPAPLYIMALASAGLVFIVYGGLGMLGRLFSRKLGFPDIWDLAVTNRQRFLIPALAGIVVGAVIIVGDLIFAPINDMGHFPHPPFPTSIVASLAAGIGEETLFRLFFISFWSWLISKVIPGERALGAIYWVVSSFSAVAFGMSHLPAIMYLQHWTTVGQVPHLLLLEIILLNGILSLVAAFYFRKFGFLAAASVHFWADMVWHVLWGLV